MVDGGGTFADISAFLAGRQSGVDDGVGRGNCAARCAYAAGDKLSGEDQLRRVS